MRLRNYYVHCATEWTDEWDCMCNDQCPECHTKDIESYQISGDHPACARSLGP